MQAITNLPYNTYSGQPHTQHSNTDNRIVNRIFWAVAIAVCLIALGSFSLSFMALYELATGNGIPSLLGWIWPLIVDLSMVIYTAAILVAQLQHRGAKLPIGLTIFYAIVTVTGNILHAPPTPLGWFVASLPSLSLILGTELLRTMGHHIILQRATVNTLAELDARVNTRKAELDKLDVNIKQSQAELERLQDAQEVLTTIEIDSILHARQVKAEQDSVDRENRLTTLVDILQGNPKESVKRLAEQLEVSRTTHLMTLRLVPLTTLFFTLWSIGRSWSRFWFELATLTNDIQEAITFTGKVLTIGLNSLAYGLGVSL